MKLPFSSGIPLETCFQLATERVFLCASEVQFSLLSGPPFCHNTENEQALLIPFFLRPCRMKREDA